MKTNRGLMNSLNKLLGLLIAAVMLAAFALPASADNKKISLTVNPTVVSPGPPTTVQATLSNVGNSNANSFELDWTNSANIKVLSATVGGTTLSAPFSQGLKGSGWLGARFTYQVPTKSAAIITLSVEVTNPCAPASVSLFAYAWTGAPGPGSSSFAFTGAMPTVSSTSSGCSTTINPQPADAFIGSTITSVPFDSMSDAYVSVQLLPAPPDGTDVSLSSLACAINDTAKTNGSGLATFSTLKSTLAPLPSDPQEYSCQLTASSTGYPDSAPSPAFRVVQPGTLGCITGANGNNTFETDTLAGARLPNVEDPEEPETDFPFCDAVPYVVTATCPTGEAGPCTQFTFDPLGQSRHIVFVLHWEWPAEAIPDGGIHDINNTVQLFVNGSPTPVVLDLCREIIPEFDGDGTFIGLAEGSPPPADQEVTYPYNGTQAGCLVRRVVQQAGDQILIVEDAYVMGDYTAIRR